MSAQLSSIAYEHDGACFEAVLAEDPSWSGPRPIVLVVHGMEGRSEAQVEFAERLVPLGYRGLAVDVFGTEVSAGGLERCGQEMNQFMQDRAGLRRRLHRIVDVAAELGGTDSERVAALGSCFGGLCVLDLARTSVSLRGVASFHDVLTAPEQAPDGRVPNPIATKVIVFHGWDDPFAPPQDVTALGRELTSREADWQLHAYGQTLHSFMATTANNPEAGILYNETSARSRAASRCSATSAQRSRSVQAAARCSRCPDSQNPATAPVVSGTWVASCRARSGSRYAPPGRRPASRPPVGRTLPSRRPGRCRSAPRRRGPRRHQPAVEALGRTYREPLRPARSPWRTSTQAR